MVRLSGRFLLCLLSLVAGSAWASDPPPNVQFESEGRSLRGWLFKPEGKNLSGPFPAVIWNHGSDPTVHPPLALAKTYNDAGFVVFYPVRRYHHPSTAGKTIDDLVSAAADNKQARLDYNEEENRDDFNALAWLNKQPYLDPDRIIVSGVSYGRVHTLLAAQKGGRTKQA